MRMRRSILRGAVAAFLSACSPLLAADFQAGVARVRITPPASFWMSGSAARTHPSEGVYQDLWAKALALRDGQGHTAVLVTTDLIGLPRAISDEVAVRVEARFAVPRQALVLGASHTHCGPAVRKNLAVLYDLAAEDRRRVDAYLLLFELSGKIHCGCEDVCEVHGFGQHPAGDNSAARDHDHCSELTAELRQEVVDELVHFLPGNHFAARF